MRVRPPFALPPTLGAAKSDTRQKDLLLLLLLLLLLRLHSPTTSKERERERGKMILRCCSLLLLLRFPQRRKKGGASAAFFLPPPLFYGSASSSSSSFASRGQEMGIGRRGGKGGGSIRCNIHIRAEHCQKRGRLWKESSKEMAFGKVHTFKKWANVMSSAFGGTYLRTVGT